MIAFSTLRFTCLISYSGCRPPSRFDSHFCIQTRQVPERPDALLFIATDRLSAFDVVMKTGIPGKGRILNQLSLFWFEMFERAGLGPHHLITGDVERMPESVRAHADAVRGRCMLVRRLDMLPVEAIVRGYIAGSGWKEYSQRGTICDIALPRGLAECERLPAPHFPLFTPSTKADVGIHDENVRAGK
jgi:phosphoribosylaminoimidazole-succinocarboxamide synthase